MITCTTMKGLHCLQLLNIEDFRFEGKEFSGLRQAVWRDVSVDHGLGRRSLDSRVQQGRKAFRDAANHAGSRLSESVCSDRFFSPSSSGLQVI